MKRRGKLLMYTLSDSVSIYNCLDVQEELLNYVSECHDICHVDASQLNDIDACGLQTLVALKKECEKKGVELHLFHIQSEIERIFRKVGLETLLNKGD